MDDSKNESPGQQNSEGFNLELLYSQPSILRAHPSSPDDYEGPWFIMPSEHRLRMSVDFELARGNSRHPVW